MSGVECTEARLTVGVSRCGGEVVHYAGVDALHGRGGGKVFSSGIVSKIVHHQGLTVRVNIALSLNYSCIFYCTTTVNLGGPQAP